MIHGQWHHDGQHHPRRLGGKACVLALLLLPLPAMAQEVVAAAAAPTVIDGSEPPQQGAMPLASPAAAEPGVSGSSTAGMPLETIPAVDYSMPAGVCPVITDYLYQQCQQNPADAMCASAVTTE